MKRGIFMKDEKKFVSVYTKKDLEKLANELLDLLLIMLTPNEIIKYLLNQDFSKDHLLELGFDEESIDELIQAKQDEQNRML
jgi:hypothetical protein